jgi:LysR family glycine cleavage system transcriptional activator
MSKGNVKPGSASGRLPSLDLLKGFEAAARLLSFTRAGEELHLTQSAVSRQIQELEDQLGVPLFHRRHRSLALTDAGQQLYPAAAQVLATMRAATDRLRAASAQKVLSVTTTPGFASLWLIPRIAGFTREHAGVEVRITAEVRIQELERDGADVAIRFCPQAMAGPGAERLFGEQVFPVCSAALAGDPKRPLRVPADLRHHVLLHLDDPDGRYPWQAWRVWLEAAGVPDLRPVGNLRFSGYDQIIPAAIAGHGVALGRTPLVDTAVTAGQLVAPFRQITPSDRAYWIVVSRRAVDRAEVADFAAWLKRAAAAENAPRARRAPRRGTP